MTLFMVIALVAGLLLATSLSQAGRLTEDLQPFLGRTVEVLVWGEPPPATDGLVATLTSTKALGAGLHIYFQVGADTSTRHLKVAQPGGTRVTGDRLVIDTARYMQWCAKRLPVVPGVPALVVEAHHPVGGVVVARDWFVTVTTTPSRGHALHRTAAGAIMGGRQMNWFDGHTF